MNRLIYNSSHLIVDSWFFEGMSYTFLDDACKEVDEKVAAVMFLNVFLRE